MSSSISSSLISQFFGNVNHSSQTSNNQDPLSQIFKEMQQACDTASQGAGAYGPPYFISMSESVTAGIMHGSSSATGTSSGGFSFEEEEMTLTYVHLSPTVPLSASSASGISSGSGSSNPFEQMFEAMAAMANSMTGSGTSSGSSASGTAAAGGATAAALMRTDNGFAVERVSFGFEEFSAVKGASSGSGILAEVDATFAEFTASFGAGASSASGVGATSASGTSSGDGSSSGLASIFAMLQKMMTTMQADLQNPGGASSASGTASSAAGTFAASGLDQFLTNLETNNGASSANGAAAAGGPMLNASQLKAVQDILTQYKDAPANAHTFKAVTDALQQAGITVSHTGHHHGAGDFQALIATDGSSSSSGSGASSGSGDSLDDLFKKASAGGATFEALMETVSIATGTFSGSSASGDSSDPFASLFGSSPANDFMSLLGGGSAQDFSTAINAMSSSGSGDSSAFINEELAKSGPLPQFLAQVDTHLNAKQAGDLQNIASQFANADGSQQTVNAIADALAKAGIPEDL